MISADIPNSIRKLVYRRDGYACALCGDPRHLHLHHVMPRSRGGGNSPMNLITLCRYCHANAHGTKLTELWIDPEEVELACVEYVSDMYAGLPWDPRFSLDYGTERDNALGFRLARAGYWSRQGKPPMWSGTTYDPS